MRLLKTKLVFIFPLFWVTLAKSHLSYDIGKKSGKERGNTFSHTKEDVTFEHLHLFYLSKGRERF